MTEPTVIDKLVSFEDAGHGNAYAIKHFQELPDDWLSALKRKVLPTKWASGEYEKLFSIPVVVVEEMQRNGADIYTMSEQEIARYLRAHGLDAFIVGRI
jgi:hypothetical protein